MENLNTEILKDIKVVVPAAEVLRLQGFKKGDIPKAEVQRILEDGIAEGCRLIKPEAIYTKVKIREIRGGLIKLDNDLALNTGNLTRFFKGCECLGIALCTIGLALENRVAELFTRKDFASALMLDSVGSVAMESVADYVNHFICQQARESGARMTPRLSPGYGKWDLSGQRALFTILPGTKIGIRLNEQCMMIPRKSISFCVGIGGGLDSSETVSPCKYCGMKDCEYRRTSPM